MKPLHKDDIQTLDLMLKTCIEKTDIDVQDLPLMKDPIPDSFEDPKINYYKRFFEIIQEWNVAEVIFADEFYPTMISIEGVTDRFYKEGGFQKKYEDQEAQRAYEATMKQKNLDDAEVSKWMKKSYWYTFGIAIAGLILAFISLLISINNE